MLTDMKLLINNGVCCEGWLKCKKLAMAKASKTLIFDGFDLVGFVYGYGWRAGKLCPGGALREAANLL